MSLVAAEAEVRSKLAKWDQEPTYRADAASAFDAAVSAFVRFREHQCSFQASLAAAGNAAEDRRLLCEIELNTSRIAYIQSVKEFLQ